MGIPSAKEQGVCALGVNSHLHRALGIVKRSALGYLGNTAGDTVANGYTKRLLAYIGVRDASLKKLTAGHVPAYKYSGRLVGHNGQGIVVTSLHGHGGVEIFLIHTNTEKTVTVTLYEDGQKLLLQAIHKPRSHRCSNYFIVPYVCKHE